MYFIYDIAGIMGKYEVFKLLLPLLLMEYIIRDTLKQIFSEFFSKFTDCTLKNFTAVQSNCLKMNKTQISNITL